MTDGAYIIDCSDDQLLNVWYYLTDREFSLSEEIYPIFELLGFINGSSYPLDLFKLLLMGGNDQFIPLEGSWNSYINWIRSVIVGYDYYIVGYPINLGVMMDKSKTESCNNARFYVLSTRELECYSLASNESIHEGYRRRYTNNSSNGTVDDIIILDLLSEQTISDIVASFGGIFVNVSERGATTYMSETCRYFKDQGKIYLQPNLLNDIYCRTILHMTACGYDLILPGISSDNVMYPELDVFKDMMNKIITSNHKGYLPIRSLKEAVYHEDRSCVIHHRCLGMLGLQEFIESGDVLARIDRVINCQDMASSGVYNWFNPVDEEVEYSSICALLVELNNAATFTGVTIRSDMDMISRLLLAYAYDLHFPLDNLDYLPNHLSMIDFNMMHELSPYFTESMNEVTENGRTWSIERHRGRTYRYKASEGIEICPSLYDIIPEISWKELSLIHRSMEDEE